jgi:hypothetical protein
MSVSKSLRSSQESTYDDGEEEIARISNRDGHDVGGGEDDPLDNQQEHQLSQR